MRLAASIVLASLALGALAPLDGGAAWAQAAPAHDPQIARLTVSGVGGVDVPADQVQIQVSVVTEAKTADAALTANQAKVEAVLAALHGAGLAEDEMSTSNFTISPTFDSGYSGRQLKISGFQVNNAVLIRSKKLDIAGKAIQAAVNAGANNIDFVQFGLSGDQGRSEAIAAAAKNARRDAEILAGASGVRLGRVRQVSMGGGERPMPMMMARMEFDAASGGAPAPSLTPGTVRVQMTVTMEFDIHE